MVRRYKELGYTGIVIADHFIGGNTHVPDVAPWNERIDRYCEGYRAAKAEGDKIGFDVFFGFELSSYGNDFVVMNIGESWLKRNPDMCEIGLVPLLQRLREAGAFVIHAHPFMMQTWIPMIRLMPQWIDAVEVVNGGKTKTVNDRALWYFKQYQKEFNLQKTASTDTHHADANFTGITLGRRVSDIKELIGEIRAGNHKLMPFKYR